MQRLVVLCLSLITAAFASDKMTAPQLIDLARSNSAGLRQAITASFDAKDLKEGTAWAGHGPDFFFATEASSQPSLIIDGEARPPMQHLAGSDFWYASERIERVGKLHSFHYLVKGVAFRGRPD